jgi:hypothetical protein
MARPVPIAILSGNVYELDNAGISKGLLDLRFARHLVATENDTTTYDDGWFGYGTFMVPRPPAPKRQVAARPAHTTGIVGGSDTDPDRPSFSKKSASPGSGGAAKTAPGDSASAETPADDPDRPVLKKTSPTPSDTTASSSGGSSTGTSTNPPADSNRPTLNRPADSSASSTAPASTPSSGSDNAGNTSTRSASTDNSDDPDRPTLRRRTPEQAKAAQKGRDEGRVTAVGSLNDDPDRPVLQRGVPASLPTEAQFAKLSGLPEDVHQMVAVSDAKDRTPHDFTRPWDDDAQRQDVLLKMQTAAHNALVAYAPLSAVTPAKSTPKPPLSAAARARAAKTVAPPPPPEPLLDEQLKSYTLSYGGAPTYVYSAHTAGQGASLRYVTVVAQVDMQGVPQVAMNNVTDATHLDRTPRMRLVDVVDAEASNRASLLFELRGQNSRQFALYRVIGARADQIFLTGTTQ